MDSWQVIPNSSLTYKIYVITFEFFMLFNRIGQKRRINEYRDIFTSSANSQRNIIGC